MKKEEKCIIWKRRYIEGHIDDIPNYIQVNAHNYSWMSKQSDATRFINQRKAVEFLQKYNIEGATIETIYE